MENFLYHFAIIGLLAIVYYQNSKLQENETKKRKPSKKVLHDKPRRNKIVKEAERPHLPQAELFPTHQFNLNGEESNDSSDIKD